MAGVFCILNAVFIHRYEFAANSAVLAIVAAADTAAVLATFTIPFFKINAMKYDQFVSLSTQKL